MSDRSQDNDNSSNEQPIHPALLQKWEQLFDCYDLDGDGVWTYKDMEIQKKRLMKQANLTPEKRADILNMMHDLWVDSFGADLNDQLNIDQYIKKMELIYRKGDMSEVTKIIRTRIFHCCDLNGDGSIDFNDFFSVEGLLVKSDTSHFKRAFHAIDSNHDGFISLKEYLDAFELYFCDPTIKMENLPLFGLPTVLC